MDNQKAKLAEYQINKNTGMSVANVANLIEQDRAKKRANEGSRKRNGSNYNSSIQQQQQQDQLKTQANYQAQKRKAEEMLLMGPSSN